MKSRLLIVLFVSILAGVASAADAQLLRLVMPDAKVVSGIDFVRVRTAPFGQFVLSQLTPGDPAFREFVSATGFDPLQDISEVVMASPADPQAKSGLLLVRGRFDIRRVLSLFSGSGKEPEMYRGVAVISTPHGPRGGMMHAVAFLDNSTVVAGDLASVRGAIDRRGSSGGMDLALANKISRISASQDAWVVSIAPISAFAPVMPDKRVKGALQGDLIKAIEQSSGGIRFGKTIDISGELTAKTEQDASSLADVVKFLMSMASMHASGDSAGQLTALLQNMSVNAEANAVKVSVSISEADLETLIKLSGGSARTPRI